MTVRIVTWHPGADPLGSAVVAIGVFDGVHIGHQALLRDTVADARARDAQAVVVTFDRDPDQIVSPQNAAPQLLTLADKLDAIGRCGVDAILVVPFTQQLAEMAPEAFLDDVLLGALTPLAVHVGSDFRFGRMAMGDVSALRMTGATHGFEVVPHELVTVGGEAVTSTRIRGLVSAGKIGDAVELLGGHPCVSGTVHRGRGEGAQLGFPTANVVPVEFAALPGAGVYAGRATIADGSGWAAAISVGTPPMFPDAEDYLEAHLVDFEGDLYDQPITLEFWERLRDQQTFASLDDLEAAIAADVKRSLEVAGFTDEEVADGPVLAEAANAQALGDSRLGPLMGISVAEQATDVDATAAAWFAADGSEDTTEESALDSQDEREADRDDADIVSDPGALEAAEQAAHDVGRIEPERPPGSEPWEYILMDMNYDKQRFLAIEGALQSAGIEHVWEPYAPAEAPLLRLGLFEVERFSVSVPESKEEDAKKLLAGLPEADATS